MPTTHPSVDWESQLRDALRGIASDQHNIRLRAARRAAQAIQMAGRTSYVERILVELEDAARFDDPGAQLVLTLLASAAA